VEHSVTSLPVPVTCYQFLLLQLRSPPFPLPGYNAPTPQRVEFRRARRRNWRKKMKLGPLGETSLSLDKFTFRVQGESATASSFASSIFWSYFPRFYMLSGSFFSYVTALSPPCLFVSVASFYSISFLMCLAPFASLPSLVAHNYTALFFAPKKNRGKNKNPNKKGHEKLLQAKDK